MVQIKKVINHNTITAEDDHGNELILMGKGLGFQRRTGDEIDEKKIEKRFFLENKGLYDKFKKLLTEISPETMRLSDDIISYARRYLKRSLSENIYLSLPDHISMAIERYHKGHLVSNGLIWEIKRMYPEEFKIGTYGLELLKKEFDIELPEDEAGFIAMHFVNAQLNEEMHNVVNITKLLKEILRIVEYHFNIALDENSMNYFRFVTHLKFFAQRIFNHTALGDMDKALYEIVKKNYPSSYECVNKINLMLEDKYNHSMSTDEKLYLMMHTQRIISRDN